MELLAVTALLLVAGRTAVFPARTPAEGRSDALVDTDHLGVIGSVESVLNVSRVKSGIVANGTTAIERLPIGFEDDSVFADDNDTVVELVGNKSSSVLDPNCSGRKGVWDAQRLSVGVEHPDGTIVTVNLDDPAISRISEESLIFLEATGEGDGSRHPTGIPNMSYSMVTSHFDSAVMSFIGNQDVTIFQQLSRVRTAQLVTRIGVWARILPDDVLLFADFDDSIVALISDQDVPVGKPSCLNWSIQEIETVTGMTKLTVLPNDPTVLIDQDHSIVYLTARHLRDNSGWSSSSCDQSVITDSFCIIDSNHRVGREIIGASAETPDDLPILSNFNHSIVELIGNQDVACSIEMVVALPMMRIGTGIRLG